MAGQIEEQNENQAGQAPADPWAAAFAALEEKSSEAPEANGADGKMDAPATGEAGSGMDAGDTQIADSGAGSPENQGGEPAGDAGNAGGLGADAGSYGGEDGGDPGDLLGVSQEELDDYRDGIVEEIRDRAIGDMAREFAKRGIRNRNGKLGATIEDEDICKRDHDGVPRFYNPETGREFTGDNPRRQAQEWVDDYNRELADAFNRACQTYSEKLMEQEAPSIAVLEFAPTYDKLDPIRQRMLDSLLDDYEIQDESGNVTGYKVDLNKALAAVNRQVEIIQSYAKSQQAPASSSQPQSSGPALDMKNSSGAAQQQNRQPQSLAEAMEMQQDALLASLKK